MGRYSGTTAQITEYLKKMTPGRKRTVLLTTLVIVLLAALTGIYLVRTSAQRHVKRALNRLDADIRYMSGYGIKDASLESYLTDLVCGRMHAEYRLDISGVPGIPVTVGADGTLDRDVTAKDMGAHTALSVMNYHIDDCETYVDDKLLYISMEEENEDYLVELDRLGDIINASLGLREQGISVPDGFAVDLFLPEETFNSTAGWLQSTDMIVTEEHEYLNLETKAGMVYECRLYHLADPDDDTHSIDMYIDRDHDIRCITGSLKPTEIASEATITGESTDAGRGGDSYTGEYVYRIVFDGADVPTDHLTVSVNNIPAGDLFTTGDMDDLSFYCSFSPDYDKTADTLDIICDKMILSAADTDLFRIKGSMKINGRPEEITALKPDDAGDVAELIMDIREEIDEH